MREKSYVQPSMNEKVASFSVVRKKTPFQKHREEEEAKKKVFYCFLSVHIHALTLLIIVKWFCLPSYMYISLHINRLLVDIYREQIKNLQDCTKNLWILSRLIMDWGVKHLCEAGL